MKYIALFTLFAVSLPISSGHDGDDHNDEVSTKVSAIEAEINKVSKALAEKEGDKKNVATKESQIAFLNSALAAATESSKADSERISELEAKLAHAEKSARSYRDALDGLHSKLSELSERIAGVEPAKTGSGDHVYQVVSSWPKYPEGTTLGSLHGDMAADSKGKVYIAVGKTIQVIGANGVFERDLGDKWGGVHGMKVKKQDGEEFLFVAQTGAKTVSKVKLDGSIVWQIVGHPKVEGIYGSPKEYNPTDVDIATDGTIYVVDGYGKSFVHVYDKDRNYKSSFGGKGKQDGKFDVCHNILIDERSENPTLLISDRQNDRLQLHAMDGSFIRTIDAELRQPCAADIYGDLLAVGELGGRLSLYDKDNKLIARLGDEPSDRKKGNGAAPETWVDGALVAVHGCTFDSKGDLYAQEWNRFGRIVKYTLAK